MFTIPASLYKNDTVYRNINNDKYNGILSCGFLSKRTKSCSNIDCVFEYYGALLLLSGEGTHIDSEGREYRLYPGCFIQRIPGKLHSTYVKPDGKWLEFFICFGRDLFLALSDINALNSKRDVLYPGVSMAIFDAFVKFMHSLKSCGQADLPLLLSEAQRIILTIYRMHMQNTTDDENMELVRQACHILKKKSSERLSIHDIASQLGIGYEKFRKLFKEKTGISPGEYCIQERINIAKSILIDTNMSVKEIALELGFSDSFAFSKQFKKIVGTSPSEFKQKH